VNLVLELVSISPIVMKIDYKPKHVEYSNIKDGKLLEILNFFTLDAADITLCDIRFTGVCFLKIFINSFPLVF
jgi:hypothetical protein